MDAVTTYEDYIQSYAKSVNRFQSLLVLTICFFAIVVDVFFLTEDRHTPEWYVFYNSIVQFFICLIAYVLMEKGIFYKYFSPIAYVRVLAFAFGMITWVGCALNLTLIQVVYVPLMFIGYAASLLKFSDYFVFGFLTIIAYFMGRTDYIHTDFKAQVWLSFDLMILFVGLLMVVVLVNRLRAHREFFNAIQTIYDQKQKSFYAAKMLSLGEMAGGMAHEINNPLMILSGLNHKIKSLVIRLSLNSDDEKKAKDILKATDEVQKIILRISKIISALREFSKVETNQDLKPVSMNAMVEMSVSLVNNRFQDADIPLSYELTNTDIKVLGSESKISQVIFQLLMNALDAVRELPEKWVKVQMHMNGDQLEVWVIDSGHGIPLELQDKIMQPFFTTKEVGKGTGLGLSTSMGIMESMNGKLDIVSDVPNTVFRITMPIHKEVPGNSFVI